MSTPLAEWVAAELAALANPEDAAQMQAYMKTDMPFFGVKATPRDAVLKAAKARFAPHTRASLIADVEALWQGPQRELKSSAVRWARTAKLLTPASMPLFERMIVEGAWWDLVDEIAIHLVGRTLRKHPAQVWPIIDDWIARDDMWLRRSAIICQIGSKQATDVDRLLRYCRGQLRDTEFFIRKAIGWALRQHGDVDPAPIIAFAQAERANMSGLTWREATRKLIKRGQMSA